MLNWFEISYLYCRHSACHAMVRLFLTASSALYCNVFRTTRSPINVRNAILHQLPLTFMKTNLDLDLEI